MCRSIKSIDSIDQSNQSHLILLAAVEAEGLAEFEAGDEAAGEAADGQTQAQHRVSDVHTALLAVHALHHRLCLQNSQRFDRSKATICH